MSGYSPVKGSDWWGLLDKHFPKNTFKKPADNKVKHKAHTEKLDEN